MKPVYSQICLCIAFCFLFAPLTKAQLQAGDIAFVGYQTTPDKFSFVVLNDISAGETIYFTDKGWKENDTFYPNEGILTWITSSTIPANSVITIENASGWTVTQGAISAPSIDLSGSGDQILVYQSADTVRFITAIHFNGITWDDDATSSNTSAIPGNLINGINAAAISNDKNYGKYNGQTSGTKDFLQSAINNRMNWVSSETSLSWSVSDYAISTHTNLSANTTLFNLNINPNESFTQPSEYELNIQGALSIKSDNNGTGSFKNLGGNLSISSVEVERYLASNDWYIISSPVDGASYSNLSGKVDTYTDSDGISYDFGPYNTTINDWGYVTALDGTYASGVGYLTRLGINESAQAISFTGPGANLNSGNLTVAYSTSGSQWNCMGNPYPSALGIIGDNMFLDVNTTLIPDEYKGVYIWDSEDKVNASDGNYYVIANSSFWPDDGIGPPGGESRLNKNNIALGQGFVIKVKPDATAALTFTTGMQIHSTEDADYTPFKSAEMQWKGLRLSVSNNDKVQRTIIGFAENMTTGLDPSFDIGILKGNPELALFTQLVDKSSETEFTTQALPDDAYNELKIPIGLDSYYGGECVFTLEKLNFPENAEVYLEDLQNANITRLDVQNTKYKTEVLQNNKGFGRFNLIIKHYSGTGTATLAPESQRNFSDFCVYYANKQIYIKGLTSPNTQFILYNLQGKMLKQNYTLSKTENSISTRGLTNGIYILNIKHAGINQSYKIVVHP